MKKIITIAATVLLVAVMTVSSSIYSYAQVKGDVNDDGGSDNKDVVALFRYVSGNNKVSDEYVYDYNNDGFANNKDVVDLFRVLSGGKDTETSAVPEEQGNAEYEIFLYGSSEGEPGNSNGQNGGKKFYGITEESKKDGMEGKTIQMFGKVYTLSYTKTMDYKLYDEKYDRYYGDGGVFMFGEKTGRLAEYYAKSADIPAEGFVPPVNAHSSRQDFIDYAKTLLLENFETSTDDCDVEIKLKKLFTSYRYTSEDLKEGFVSFIDEDPNFYAEYRIIFYKRFNGMNRIDDIEIDITSEGRVLLIHCRTCDEKIEKFEDVSIDVEQLKKQLKELSYDPSYLSYSMLLRAVPEENELWVLADVNYEYDKNGNIFGSLTQYVTKVAEIPSDQTEPDPVDTEFETWDAYAGTEAE